MEDVLLSIQDRIAAEAASVAWTSEDWGQMEMEQPPVKYPAALVDLLDVAWTNTGKGAQTGLARFTVKVATLAVTNSSTKAPERQRKASASIWGVLVDVYKALQGFSPKENVTALIRTGTRKVRRTDGVRLFEYTFSCQVYDESAERKPAGVFPVPVDGPFIELQGGRFMAPGQFNPHTPDGSWP